MGEYTDTQIPLLLGWAIALIIVANSAVIFRFWSRAVASDAPVWWDDWTILGTLVFTNLNLAFAIWGTHVGLGRHMKQQKKEWANTNAFVQMMTLIFYSTAENLLKISALLLYARIFKIERRFRIILWVTGVAVTIWWILLLIIPWTHCTPAKKAYYPLTKGHCHGGGVPWYLGSSITNTGLDLIILLLPMPMIWRLKMRLQKRIQLSLVFLVGYSSAFVSLARFSVVASNPGILNTNTDKDLSWKLTPLLLLSMIEPPLGIVALCGPPVRQLITLGIREGFGSIISRSSASHSQDQSSANGPYWRSNKAYGSSDAEGNWSPPRSQNGLTKAIGAFRKSRDTVNTSSNTRDRSEEGLPEGVEMPMERILLKREIEITPSPAP